MDTTSKLLVESTLAAIQPVQGPIIDDAIAFHSTLTKPVGSLGRLEEIGAALCGIQRQVR